MRFDRNQSGIIGTRFGCKLSCVCVEMSFGAAIRMPMCKFVHV